MLAILSITGPIYLLMGLGWASVRFGAFDAAGVRALGLFTLRLCLPALLFQSLASRPIVEVLDLRYLAAYTAGSLAVLVGGFALMRCLRRAPVSLAAMQGMGMCSSNSGFVGYAVLQQFMGPVAGVLLALTLIVENLIVMPAAMATADADTRQGWRHALRTAFAGLVRNPLVIAIGCGFAFALLGVRLPETVARTVSLLAAAASPVALFVVGGSLVGRRLAGVRLDLGLVAIGKLLVHPAAVAAAIWLLPPSDPQLATGAVVLASMPMVGIYPLLASRWGHEGFCAAALFVTTGASFFTITAALWLLR